MYIASRNTFLSRAIALLVLLTLIVAGCSSGGSSSGTTQSASTGDPVAAADSPGYGNVTIVVKRDSEESTLNVIPVTTTIIRARVLGTNISTQVDFPRGASQVDVVLTDVPVGRHVIVVEALAGDTVVARGSVEVDVAFDALVTGAVSLTPVPTPPPTIPPITGGSLRFVGIPSRIGRALNFAPFRVVALDTNGNVNTSFSAEITLSLENNPGGASLGGVTTGIPLNGEVTFDRLDFSVVGSGYTLRATGGGLTGVSGSIEVVEGHFAFVRPMRLFQTVLQPLVSNLGNGPVIVEVRAPDETSIASARGKMLVELAPNAAFPGAVLGGTREVDLDTNGQATFSDLTVTRSGSAFELKARNPFIAAPATSTAFTVLPRVGAGAMYVGLSDGASNREIRRYDLADIGLHLFTRVTYTPKAMTVVANGTLLFVAGDDGLLHIYNASDLTGAGPDISLGGTPSQMRYDPSANKAYVSIPLSSKVKLIEGTASAQVPADLVFPSHVTGLAIDPATTPGFWMATHEQSPTYRITKMGLGTGPDFTDPQSTLPLDPGDSFVDLTSPAGATVGIISFGVKASGSNSLRAFRVGVTVSPLEVATYGVGAPAQDSDDRRQVRFYNTGPVVARALVANNSTGNIEIAAVTAVPTIAVDDTASDPTGLIAPPANPSGADSIALAVNRVLGLPVNTLAMVTDPRQKRILLVDLTGGPEIFGQLLLNPANPSAALPPTAITVHQDGETSTY